MYIWHVNVLLIFVVIQARCDFIRIPVTAQEGDVKDLWSLKAKWNLAYEAKMRSKAIKNTPQGRVAGSKLLQNLRINEKGKEKNHGNYTDFSLYTAYGNAYLINLYAGSENQEFKVLLDTGSSYTWLTHSNCTTCQELGIVKNFDCDKSTTCASKKEEIKISYGKGVVYATVFRDRLGFDYTNLFAKNQDFLLATKIEELDYFPGQGLIGLGFDILSDGRKTIFDNLKEQGTIIKRQFAFSLSGVADDVEFGQTNQDFFIIGGDGIDPKLAEETDSFTCPVIFRPYWSVQVQSIQPIISDVELDLHLSSQVAIIDTGTSFIVFNEEDFEILKKFFFKLKKLNCEMDVKLNLLFCKSVDPKIYPIFKFSLCDHSRSILLYPNQYLLCDETLCYIRIGSISFGFTIQKIVILGDIFIRSQYILFNQDDMNISFFKKKSANKMDAFPEKSAHLSERLKKNQEWLDRVQKEEGYLNENTKVDRKRRLMDVETFFHSLEENQKYTQGGTQNYTQEEKQKYNFQEKQNLEEKQKDNLEENQKDNLEEKQKDNLEEKQKDNLEENQRYNMEENQKDNLEESQKDTLEEKQNEEEDQKQNLEEKQKWNLEKYNQLLFNVHSN